jgi:hypothetical protein
MPEKHVRKSRKFKTPKEFRDALWSYLDTCAEKKEMPNIAGFCAFREIGKRTYYDYAKRYPHIKRAFEAVVENVWLQRLAGTSATGAIFYLKNAFREDYKDRNETDITSKGESLVVNLIDFKKKQYENKQKDDGNNGNG